MSTLCSSLSNSFSATQSSLVLKTQLRRNGPPPWASAGTRASISRFWLAFTFSLITIYKDARPQYTKSYLQYQSHTRPRHLTLTLCGLLETLHGKIGREGGYAFELVDEGIHLRVRKVSAIEDLDVGSKCITVFAMVSRSPN